MRHSLERWQLPDGIDDVLPREAAQLESLRRRLLDLYASWGYRLVIPPLVEFTDSLLVGVGADLNLLTFKFPDQLSGRTLGIRSDIAPQVARMDAHSLGEEGVTRLCYAGSVLHSRPQAVLASRSLIQAGAEIYGEPGLGADLEVIQLMLRTVEGSGALAHDRRMTLDLGHGGVYRAVCEAGGLDGDTERAVFDALQRKSRPDLERLAAGLGSAAAAALMSLLDLHGGTGILERARHELGATVPDAVPAIETLGAVVDRVEALEPGVDIYIDLGELRGHHYHTGIVFAAYLPGRGAAVANGGRYDNVGAEFGRARPATGFATDLKVLAACVDESEVPVRGAISAPDSDDARLRQAMETLRAEGEVVIVALGGRHDPRCDRELSAGGSGWTVRALRGHTEEQADA